MLSPQILCRGLRKSLDLMDQLELGPLLLLLLDRNFVLIVENAIKASVGGSWVHV